MILSNKGGHIMEYDEMMNVLESISKRYGTTLEILSSVIGYEFTENLLNPLFDYILPSKDSMETESFLKAIDEVATKIFFYMERSTSEMYYFRIEDFVKHYKLPPEECLEYGVIY